MVSKTCRIQIVFQSNLEDHHEPTVIEKIVVEDVEVVNTKTEEGLILAMHKMDTNKMVNSEFPQLKVMTIRDLVHEVIQEVPIPMEIEMMDHRPENMDEMKV